LLCIGLGCAKMGRAEMFRVQHGVAVEMEQRVYEVPSPTLDGEWAQAIAQMQRRLKYMYMWTCCVVLAS
jgi:hypothetical protein